MKYLYDRSGEAVAVLEQEFIFNMDGYAVGFVQSKHVYSATGEHVGEIHQDMVVAGLSGNPGSIQPPQLPGRIPSPQRIPGRGTMDYGLPDRIHELLAP